VDFSFGKITVFQILYAIFLTLIFVIPYVGLSRIFNLKLDEIIFKNMRARFFVAILYCPIVYFLSLCSSYLFKNNVHYLDEFTIVFIVFITFLVILTGGKDEDDSTD